MAGNSRTLGHNFEREMRLYFKEKYPDVQTSRYANRLLDDCKVDLEFIPYNLQLKAGKMTGMIPLKEIKLVKDSLLNSPFRDRLEQPTLLIHKRKYKRINAICVFGELNEVNSKLVFFKDRSIFTKSKKKLSKNKFYKLLDEKEEKIIRGKHLFCTTLDNINF